MGSMILGNVDWVLCKGYPQLSGSDEHEQITVKYTAGTEGFSLPGYGSAYVAAAGWDSQFSGMHLTGRSVVPLDSGSVLEVTLVYEYNENDIPDAIIRDEWEYDTQDYDVPLAKHSKYLYCWNHKLAAKTSAGSSVPAWFETAKNEVLAGRDAQNYKWLRPSDKCPEGYSVIAQETKRGVESFRRGITTVQWVRRCSSKAKLAKEAQNDYTIQTPKETFGKTGKWLRGGSKIRKNGRKWELTVSFLNSKDYDVDLYN